MHMRIWYFKPAADPFARPKWYAYPVGQAHVAEGKRIRFDLGSTMGEREAMRLAGPVEPVRGHRNGIVARRSVPG